MPTDLLRTFVTIKDLGGFTSAGELLGRSQPAISLQVKKLEELLGYYNRQRPHTFNAGIPPALAEEKLKTLSGIN
ncbi:helix-turn-helix domain-containing protein [Salinicola salarius]|uniref:helix-turn-helix domain-containing protein n=1 Tax=Salinicola salarius TaxID=430457 RepID=UPI00358F48A2